MIIKSIPVPRWASQFGATGELPADRTSNASGRTIDELEEIAEQNRYAEDYRRAVSKCSNSKGECAQVILRFAAGTPEHREAVTRSHDLDEEIARMGVVYRAGAPLTPRSFAPLDVATRERVDAPAKSSQPLFDRKMQTVEEALEEMP